MIIQTSRFAQDSLGQISSLLEPPEVVEFFDSVDYFLDVLLVRALYDRPDVLMNLMACQSGELV
jgi:hypothetical protein